MNKIRIVVADGNFLTREGLKALVKENRDFLFADDTDSGADLQRKIGKVRPDVLIIDHTSTGFSLDDLKGINKTFPFLRILAITRAMSKTFINQSLDAGVNSYLLKDWLMNVLDIAREIAS